MQKPSPPNQPPNLRIHKSFISLSFSLISHIIRANIFFFSCSSSSQATMMKSIMIRAVTTALNQSRNPLNQQPSNILIPAATTFTKIFSSNYSSKSKSKGDSKSSSSSKGDSKSSSSKGSKGKKGKKASKSSKSKTSSKKKGKGEEFPSSLSATAASDETGDLDAFVEEDSRALRLAEEINDKSLDVGPNGRPLFTTTESISKLTRKDTGAYKLFNMDELNAVLPEGLPVGMITEFEEAKRSALLIRQGFLDLRDNFRRIVDPPLRSSSGRKAKKQIVLDGPVSSGKSIALAMLVHWARDEGWLVLYVPKGKEWTHGGFFYKNPQTDLWDTPVQASKILQDFLKYNESRFLQKLPCQIFDPIPLGEGAGVGWLKGVDSMAMPEGSTLFDLVKTGIDHTHAAVGVVVRLRKELSLVKDIPVLIAIDQYNNWFTFSEYEEPVTARSCRPIHARELATVNAFRSMIHNDMMVGAFSHSTAVGKLRQDLPDVPVDARVDFPRYNLDEAATVCHYYLRQRLIRREAFSDEKWKKIFFLANGNGSEIRWLAPFIR